MACASPITASPRRLLIVEDEGVVALDLREALEELGYQVVGTAASSDEAVQQAELCRADLVLMDIRIAGLADGIETATLLRERFQLPVVYLTANADARALARALETEPAGYLVKPYNYRTLRTTIEVAFRRHASELALREAHERERRQFERRTAAAMELADQLRREATIDALTGLYNRRHLEHAMAREICLGEREHLAVGVILLDLDRFKQLNDTFGHPAGDTALRAVANLLRERLRVYDIACRYGGEEIVVIVPGASTFAAWSLAEQLRVAIAQLAVTHAGDVLELTASFGVSSFPRHGVEAGVLLEAADAALYRAKAEGRNRVVSAPSAAPAADDEGDRVP